MISVAVVGLGRIGSKNGHMSGPEGQVPLSHVGAVLANPEIGLAAMVDPDPAARDDAARLWQGQTSAPVLEFMDRIPSGSVDVVTLCTPTAQRGTDVATALALRPKVLIVEKPLAADLIEAQRLHTATLNAGVTLQVNYNRRHDPRTRAFAESFPGIPKKVILRYGRGLFNYASHMIDLLMQWFGPIQTVQSRDRCLASVDKSDGDRNIDFWCRLESGVEAIFIGLDGLDYDQLDIELYFADQRLSYLSGGAEQRAWHSEADLFYQGYSHLAEGGGASTGQIGGFRELYDNVHQHLAFNQPLTGCDGTGAVLVQAVLAAVVRSTEDGGIPIEIDDFIERYEKGTHP
jgi:UDP-N-acetyl-2-amino-2-deoxyglucuronate dehydrogenase